MSQRIKCKLLLTGTIFRRELSGRQTAYTFMSASASRRQRARPIAPVGPVIRAVLILLGACSVFSPNPSRDDLDFIIIQRPLSVQAFDTGFQCGKMSLFGLKRIDSPKCSKTFSDIVLYSVQHISPKVNKYVVRCVFCCHYIAVVMRAV